MDRHVFGLMVFGNEAHRYLYDAVRNAAEAVDVLLCFDDQSVDGSADIVRSLTGTGHVLYVRRSDDTPTFLEHEGRFRQAAYDSLKELRPRANRDWILSIDSDEALVGLTECRPCEVKTAIDAAERAGCLAVNLHVYEVFGYDRDWPMVRTDGYWGQINGTRLFRYLEGGVFKDADMACGSEPTYVNTYRPYGGADIALMHYGYAEVADLQARYQRYSTRTGHSNQHVQSIVSRPQLQRWEGLVPPVMRRGASANIGEVHAPELLNRVQEAGYGRRMVG